VKLISTRVHGILDYITAGALASVPRLLGCRNRTSNLLLGMAAGTTCYSLVTRYEYSAVKWLPMRVHLLLDGLSGAMLAAAPFVLLDEDTPRSALVAGLGLYEVTVAALTRTKPPLLERGRYAYLDIAAA
jgi:hypothetical protein